MLGRGAGSGHWAQARPGHWAGVLGGGTGLGLGRAAGLASRLRHWVVVGVQTSHTLSTGSSERLLNRTSRDLSSSITKLARCVETGATNHDGEWKPRKAEFVSFPKRLPWDLGKGEMVALWQVQPVLGECWQDGDRLGNQESWN